MVETKLYSYHVGVLVPSYGFDVLRPHRLALHRTGQFHLIRSKPAGSFSKNIHRGNIMHARRCHHEALFLFNEAQLSVYRTNSCRFAKRHGWICYLSPKPVTLQVTRLVRRLPFEVCKMNNTSLTRYPGQPAIDTENGTTYLTPACVSA